MITVPGARRGAGFLPMERGVQGKEVGLAGRGRRTIDAAGRGGGDGGCVHEDASVPVEPPAVRETWESFAYMTSEWEAASRSAPL
jgi:hypothetical protein